MGDFQFKSNGDFLKSIFKSTIDKKYIFITLFVLILLVLSSGLFGISKSIEGKIAYMKLDLKCGDGTNYRTCSEIVPYFCADGSIIELPYLCGCPEGSIMEGNSCISEYHTGSKVISLKYVLDSKTDSISFLAYEGFYEYVENIPRTMKHEAGMTYSIKDFKLNVINEGEQRKFLMPLVKSIQNKTKDKTEQARIAISIVQNIPFGSSNKTINFFGENVNYTRYPYEVIYDLEGVCAEKSDLLSFLLKELGYGVASFYYPLENHEAIGIKCPVEESLMNTGYCFVETTGPSIISDSGISYSGGRKLDSIPEFYLLYDGDALGKDLQEYKDAVKFQKIRESAYKSGLIGPLDKKKIDKINKRYGLFEEYSK